MVIGVDIGGTKIRAVSWTGHKVARSVETKTPNNQRKLAKEVQKVVRAVADKKQITNIGIGAAGVIRGTVLILSPNIPAIKRFNFSGLWPSSVSICVDNDARCFARGEYLLGAGKNAESIFALTIGTGIGRAYGKNGKIQKIKKFEHPEYWEREYQRICSTNNDATLAEFLAENLAPLLVRFKSEVVVIGGGVMKRQGFLNKIRASLNRKGVVAKIRGSRLGGNAVAFGAILLVNKANT